MDTLDKPNKVLMKIKKTILLLVLLFIAILLPACMSDEDLTPQASIENQKSDSDNTGYNDGHADGYD